jgi:hypothetical protein
LIQIQHKNLNQLVAELYQPLTQHFMSLIEILIPHFQTQKTIQAVKEGVIQVIKSRKI